MGANRVRLVGAASLVVLAAACGGDEGKSAPPGGDYTPTAANAARDYLASLDRQAMSFEEVVGRFDVNLDGIVDAADVAALQRCIDAKASVDQLACDIVPDGVIDEADAIALSVALGEHRRVPDERIAEVAQALRDNAQGKWEPSLVGSHYDWNHDGLLDAADVSILADRLSGDRSIFDLNGDGAVTLADAAALAERQARAKFSGGASPATDLDGDGASAGKDLVLLAEIAIYTADVRPGWFDTNLDGKIDERDFCRVTNSPSQTSYYDLLMPKAAADAAFAAAVPTFSVCRADGRPIARNRARFDTQHVVKLAPSNLFLQPVGEIPAGYAPADPSLATGRQLYIVSTTPSAHPVRAITLPWNVTLAGGDDLSLRVDGEALPENASLLLPGSITPLAKAPSNKTFRSGTGADVTVPLPDVAAGNDAAAAAELIANVATAKQTYEALIAGCPCSLTPQERDALVSWLLRAGSCLDTTLASAKSKLAAAEQLESALARQSAIANNGSAGYHELLANNYFVMEIISTIILGAEVGYDTATGGLGKALGNQVTNLISEELGPDTSREGYVDGVAGDTVVSAGLNPVSAAVQTLTEMFLGVSDEQLLSLAKNPDALRDFLNKNFTGRNFTVKSTLISTIEAVIKSMIKRVPKDFIRTQELEAKRIEHEATQYAAEHRAAMLAAANLRFAVRALEGAKSTIQQLRTAFLAKLQADGCGVTVRPTNPCAFDLQSAIDRAGEELLTAAAAAEAQLDRARAGGGNASSEETCNSSRTSITRTELDLATLARDMQWRSGADREAAARKLEVDMTRAVEEYSSESLDLARFACLLSYDTSAEDIQAIHDAELARKKALDDYQRKVDEALAAYEACGDGGACGFDSALSPWAAGAKCLGCLPTFTMSCCGDGKLQTGEACDPGTPGVACATQGQVCTASCTCQEAYGQVDTTGDLTTTGGAPAGANGDPAIDIARSETYVDAASPTFPWIRVVVAGPFPPSSTYYSWYVKIVLLDAGMTEIQTFTVERHAGSDAQYVTGSVPQANVTYIAEPNGFKVRFGGALSPAQYRIESGLLKVSSGGTFVRDLSGPHAFMATPSPW